MLVWIALKLRLRLWDDAFCSFRSFFFSFSFFFCFHAYLEECGYCSMNSTWIVATNVNFSQWTVHSCTVYGPTNLFFINFFIKNGSHGTIYTFKNYFATVFFSFQFQFSVFSCIQTDSYAMDQFLIKIKIFCFTLSQF